MHTKFDIYSFFTAIIYFNKR